MKASINTVASGVAVILFLLMSAAWLAFENFTGRLPEAAGRVAQLILLPGWFVDIWASGSYHGGFGDWRDFAVMVFVSWALWMIPVFLIWRSARRERFQREDTGA